MAVRRFVTREQWLHHALIKFIHPHFQAAGYTVPDNIRVSCGWPCRGGMRAKSWVAGQAWAEQTASDGFFNIFISPRLDDPSRILDILIHEVVHCTVGLQAGHRKPFVVCMRAVGLTGKATATVASEALKPVLAEWSASLGPFPHGALVAANTGTKQSTRLVKVECEACGCLCRMTRKWLDEVGPPTCGCGSEMTADDGGDE